MASSWTLQEEAIIREHYAIRGSTWLAEGPLRKRTAKAIRDHAALIDVRGRNGGLGGRPVGSKDTQLRERSVPEDIKEAVEKAKRGEV